MNTLSFFRQSPLPSRRPSLPGMSESSSPASQPRDPFPETLYGPTLPSRRPSLPGESESTPSEPRNAFPDATSGPITVADIIIFDRSGSMEGDIGRVHEAIANRLRFRRLRFPRDFVGVLAFSDYVSEVVHLAPNRDVTTEMHAQVHAYGAGGATELLPALELAVARFSALPEYVKRRAVVFTDGELHDKAWVRDYIPTLQAEQVRVDTVSYRNANRGFMFHLARSTRGIAYDAHDLDHLCQLLEKGV